MYCVALVGESPATHTAYVAINTTIMILHYTSRLSDYTMAFLWPFTFLLSLFSKLKFFKIENID